MLSSIFLGIIFSLALVTKVATIVTPLLADEYYQTLGVENVEESYDLIKNVPISHYWDAKKRRFQVGVVPIFNDEEKSRFGRIIHDGIGVVDIDKLLMQFICALQFTLKQFETLQNRVDSVIGNLTLHKDNQAYREHGDHSRVDRLATTRFRRQILNISNEILMIQHERFFIDRNFSISIEKDVFEGKLNLIAEHIENMSIENREHKEKILDIRKEKLVYLLDITNSSESEKLSMRFGELQVEYDHALALFKSEIQATKELILFRAQQIIKSEKDIEMYRLKNLNAKGEASKNGFDVVVKTMFSELSNRFASFFSDPVQQIKYILPFLFAFLIIIALHEVIVVLRDWLTSIIRGDTKNLFSNSVRFRFGASNERNIFVVDDVTKTKYESIIDILNCAVQCGGPLPTGLILGPPGCGKTLGALRIATLSKLPYVLLTGGDFMSMTQFETVEYFRKLQARKLKGQKLRGGSEAGLDFWNVSRSATGSIAQY